MVSSSSLAIITLVTMTLPVTWFPDHRGKVIGFIASGFGLSSTGNHKTLSNEFVISSVFSVLPAPVCPC